MDIKLSHSSNILRVKTDNNDCLPVYSSQEAAGMDLRANVDEPVEIQPFGRALIPTGIKIAVEPGYEAQIRPRSGLAIKHGVTVLNTPGTIDSDYRGEVGVILINLGEKPFIVEKGMRIAQMVINKIQRVDIIKVDELPETDRGEGGFGSTGIK